MKNKYGNKKIEYNGMVFDSKREFARYKELELLERAGKIRHLQRQVKYQLLPSMRDPDTKKVIERPIFYIADFTYVNEKGKFIVEDVKGYKTADYLLKRKMMLFFHGIRIKET